jgi:hypothetical protein
MSNRRLSYASTFAACYPYTMYISTTRYRALTRQIVVYCGALRVEGVVVSGIHTS